jgi:uridine kinase
MSSTDTGTRPVIIGVAGGSGSGKTTVVREIVSRLGPEDVALIQHDSYYRDRSELSPTERAKVNYDHPDSLETSLLVKDVRSLRDGHAVNVPVYDFSTHTRTAKVVPLVPRKVVIVEGILVLADPDLRAQMAMRVFVDTDPDIRMIRRLRRDMKERGRTLDSVVTQYLESVRPMHLEFVEPSKRHAHIIIPEGGENFVAVEMLVARIHDMARGV